MSAIVTGPLSRASARADLQIRSAYISDNFIRSQIFSQILVLRKSRDRNVNR